MFKPLQVLDESNSILRKKAKDVKFPLEKNDLNLIKDIITHLKYSQIVDKAEKYQLRPGMGLAFPQVGFLKRIIVIVHEYEEDNFKNYIVINPKIISHSVEEIAAFEGEGCLSINREVSGHVKRFARITVAGFNEKGEEIKIRARDELAIAFQHEIDHLDGILFCDRIDVNKPFLSENEINFI